MAVEGKMRLELSFLTTYVHGDGTIFRKGEVYEMSIQRAEEMLGQRDEDGSPYFRRWKARVKPAVVDPDVPQGVVRIPDAMKTGDGNLTAMDGTRLGGVRIVKKSDKLGADGDTGSAAVPDDEDGVTV